MRVYISVDMEGVAGVVHESQTDPTNPACAAEYARFRRLMTAEANAAIEGALAAGATKLVVNDSHWFMRNLLAEELHQAAELLSGDPKPQSMVEGIDGGFDAALFIGYHARAGTRHAILDHTYADRIHDVRLNGRPVGELGINAAFAGVAGVPVALVSGDSALVAEARELLGDHVAAVVVNDSHWFMRNLLAEELHQAAELLSGDPKPRSMVEGIDSGFDAALFIGYHARAGTPHAVLDHTYADRIHEVRLNGRPVGELGINAALAGVAGVPVAVVSGDSSVAAEARALLGEDVATVVVKQAVSRHAARSVAPAVACRMIREGVAAALTQKHAPLVLPPPITVEVDFALTIHADMAELCPGATRTAGRTVAFTHQDYREVFRGWRAMLNLSAVVE